MGANSEYFITLTSIPDEKDFEIVNQELSDQENKKANLKSFFH